MDGAELHKICTRFSGIYKFSDSQKEKLFSKFIYIPPIRNSESGEEAKEKTFKGLLKKMKTYIKKKEIDEEPMPNSQEDMGQEDDDFESNNIESTDTSKKSGSESSPAKETVGDIRKEIDVCAFQEQVEAQLEKEKELDVEESPEKDQSIKEIEPCSAN
jgi:hypothetical protein